MSAAKTPSAYLDAESKFKGSYSKQLLNTLAQGYRPYRARTWIWLVLGLTARLALLGCINIIGLWADHYAQKGAVDPATTTGLRHWTGTFATQDWLHLLFGLVAYGFVVTALFRTTVSRISCYAVSQIYDETTLRVSRAPMTFFDRNPVGRIVTRFSSDYNNLFRIFGGPITEFAQLVFDLIAMAILVAVASPWLVPFWILLAGMSFGLYRLQVQALRVERRELSARRSPSIAHFAETAQGASTIRAFGREDTFFGRFQSLSDSYLEQRLSLQTVMFKFFVSLQGVSPVVFLALGLAGLWLVPTGRLSTGDLGVAFAYLGLSVMVFGSFFEWLGQFEEAMTGLERMDQYLRLPIEDGTGLPPSAQFITAHPLRDRFENPTISTLPPAASVEVKHLSFRYREDLPFVLNDINFSLAPGTRLGVVGRTGSGKSSLIQALLMLYPIDRGEIRIDGKRARLEPIAQTPGPEWVGIESYRRFFSWISQEPTLFRGTLRENLGSPERTDGERIESLQRVGILDPLATQKDAVQFLNQTVEERGRNLSAGERQLVCMARCLLQDAPVLILDEATSAVDPQSEELLTRATETFFKGRTQIVIAHRLSTIESCDQILWLDQGKLKMMGTPAEVLPPFRAARKGSSSGAKTDKKASPEAEAVLEASWELRSPLPKPR